MNLVLFHGNAFWNALYNFETGNIPRFEKSVVQIAWSVDLRLEDVAGGMILAICSNVVSPFPWEL